MYSDTCSGLYDFNNGSDSSEVVEVLFRLALQISTGKAYALRSLYVYLTCAYLRAFNVYNVMYIVCNLVAVQLYVLCITHLGPRLMQ